MTETERLTDLEIRIAYMEDTLAALDRVIAGQSGQIERLEAVNKTLYDRLAGLQERLEDAKLPAAEIKPPHY